MNLIDELEDPAVCVPLWEPWHDTVHFMGCGLQVTGELARMDMQPPIVQECRLAHKKHHYRCKTDRQMMLVIREERSGIFTHYKAECEHL